MVPARGIMHPDTQSNWAPRTGTCKPEPSGSGYSNPGRAGKESSMPGSLISPNEREESKNAKLALAEIQMTVNIKMKNKNYYK